jgi:hypothetical protein
MACFLFSQSHKSREEIDDAFEITGCPTWASPFVVKRIENEPRCCIEDNKIFFPPAFLGETNPVLCLFRFRY